MASSPELENLARIGTLHRERPSRREYEGLVRSGELRLADARRSELSSESRFDLAYNAAHALALAALRHHGYRSDNRYVVFQALPHTLGLPASSVRILAAAHQHRNRSEYEGAIGVADRLLAELIDAAADVLAAVRRLPPLPEPETSG
jgi:hypothetical protein